VARSLSRSTASGVRTAARVALATHLRQMLVDHLKGNGALRLSTGVPSRSAFLMKRKLPQGGMCRKGVVWPGVVDVIA